MSGVSAFLDESSLESLRGALRVDVAGVSLRVRGSAPPRAPADASHDAAVVLTPSARGNLHRLAFAVALSDALGPRGGRPVLLEGPPGSGKTTILRHLARAVGFAHDLIELHLDDATDGKALLGTYVCTDVPGEFSWQAGAVTAAAAAGRWLLIEDLDRAPFEVLAALSELLESRTLALPGRARQLSAHPDFQMFATRSCVAMPAADSRSAIRLQPISGPLATFSDRWLRVPFASLGGGEGGWGGGGGGVDVGYSGGEGGAPSTVMLHPNLALNLPGRGNSSARTEMCELLTSLFPSLPAVGVIDNLLDCYSLVESFFGSGRRVAGDSSKDTYSGAPMQQPAALSGLDRFGRTFSARDAIRWARRVERLTPVIRRVASALEINALAATAAASAPGTSAGSAAASRPVFLTESDKLAIVLEGVSVVAGHIPAADVQLAIARSLATAWGLAPDAANDLLCSWKPEIGYRLDAPLPSSSSAPLPSPAPLSGERGRLQLCVGNISVPVLATASSAVSATLGHLPQPLPAGFAPTRHSLRLLERLAACVVLDEPALLVGETGNGKTSVIQALAGACGAQLLVYNMNVQSDSADLLGGFKPVHLRQIAVSLLARFERIFAATFRGASGNVAFVDAVRSAVIARDWGRAIGGFSRAVQHAQTAARGERGPNDVSLDAEWARFGVDVRHFERQFSCSSASVAGNGGASTSASDPSPQAAAFAFSYVDGILVQALRAGHWLLLDEINLASAETLQRLAGLLEGGSVTLVEKGEAEAVPRHPNFRLFAAMNPATDFGKRNLPPALRARLSEIYVPDVEAEDDLSIIAAQHISGWPASQSSAEGVADLVRRVVGFYVQARRLAAPITGSLRDGASSRPHYSLRSLTRALKAATFLIGAGFNALQACSEGMCVFFLTQLEESSAATMHQCIRSHFGPAGTSGPAPSLASSVPATDAGPVGGAARRREKQAQLALGVIARLGGGTDGARGHSRDEADGERIVPQRPRSSGDGDCGSVLVQGFWLQRGPLVPVDLALPEPGSGIVRYVLVPSVQRHLRSLARAAACGRFPVLLQGPTSAGKTSLVEYLARLTGHECVRINNHEHTDLAEYLGSYATSPQGRLEFCEGLLVTALRRGHWLILDELNLAPSEVLEALNRLLDDNRELFVPETQETVRPHANFMLFATQNPSGAAYGGRKPLSLAFRNRFVELHVDDIPAHELHAIVMQRSRLPSSFVEKMIAVMLELQRLRQGSDVFAGRHGFITPRDLLRWAQRQPRTYQSLAEEGFALLGERLRLAGERETVLAVLERACKVKVDLKNLYDTPFESNGHTSSNGPALGATREVNKTSGSKRSSAPEARQDGLRAKRPREGDGDDDPMRVSDASAFDSAHFMPLALQRLHLFIDGLSLSRDADAATQQPQQQDQQLQPLDNKLQHDCAEAELNLRPGAVPGTEGLTSLTLTRSLRRLFDLVGRCIANDEPVLLVGDTGCGKTTVVQLFALLMQRPLHVVNCHAHSETADILGSLRPVRNRSAHLDLLRQAVEDCISAAATALVAAPANTGAGQVPSVSPEEWRCKADACSSSATGLVQLAREVASSTPATPFLSSALARAESEVQSCTSLFEWADGPLVQAMRGGDFFLLDEASLAEDAVLERLNSVLEPGRSLTLAEMAEHAGAKGPSASVRAAPSFRIFATMNPGGDFGKRELSPALRNRFTEIWVPALSSEGDEGAADDLRLIISDKAIEVAASCQVLDRAPVLRLESNPLLAFVDPMVRFMQWFEANASSGRLLARSAGTSPQSRPRTTQGSRTFQLTLRDVHSWLGFMGSVLMRADQGAELERGRGPQLSPWEAFAHGACLVLLDGLGLGMGLVQEAIDHVRAAAARVIVSLAPPAHRAAVEAVLALTGPAPSAMQLSDHSRNNSRDIDYPSGLFGLSPFFISRGQIALQPAAVFALGASTTRSNLLRVLRALQLKRPVLLEGSPGVGKTSLIEAIARQSGHRLVRINLSDQTDVSDLFGQDLPVTSQLPDNGESGGFAWSDGVFLRALRAGDWVLLDELNLAQQAVLEGLNAVLDHRGTVFIPELGRSFPCAPGFRVFATQNPVAQGGGRKGLPKSFLNRFAKVFVEALSTDDQLFIARVRYPMLDVPFATNGVSSASPSVLSLMARYCEELHADTMGASTQSSLSGRQLRTAAGPLYGAEGRPWEFNLRDLFRWCDLVVATQEGPLWNPGFCVEHAMWQRLRRASDRAAAAARYFAVFGAHSIQAFATTDGRSPTSQAASLVTLHSTPTLRVSPDAFAIDDVLLPRAPLAGVWPCASGVLLTAGLPLPRRILAAAATQPVSVSRAREESGAGGGGRGGVGPLTASLLRPMYHCAAAVAGAAPVLLVGRPSSGKTACISHLARLCGARLRIVPLTPTTDATELVGCFEQADQSRLVANVEDTALGLAAGLLAALAAALWPDESARSAAAAAVVAVSACERTLRLQRERADPSLSGSCRNKDFSGPRKVFEDLVAAVDIGLSSTFEAFAASELAPAASSALGVYRERLSALRMRAANCAWESEDNSAASGRGVFEWVDGTLVEAMERGEWVVVENVNFCAASVVDRLNPLLEPGGSLLISEGGLNAAGAPRIVSPAPAFRIFFTLNPALGDVSRALRNRCVEIAMDADIAADSEAIVSSRLVDSVLGPSPDATVAAAARLTVDRLLGSSAPHRVDVGRIAALGSAYAQQGSAGSVLSITAVRGAVEAHALAGAATKRGSYAAQGDAYGTSRPRLRQLLYFSDSLRAFVDCGTPRRAPVARAPEIEIGDLSKRAAAAFDLIYSHNGSNDLSLTAIVEALGTPALSVDQSDPKQSPLDTPFASDSSLVSSPEPALAMLMSCASASAGGDSFPPLAKAAGEASLASLLWLTACDGGILLASKAHSVSASVDFDVKCWPTTVARTFLLGGSLRPMCEEGARLNAIEKAVLDAESALSADVACATLAYARAFSASLTGPSAAGAAHSRLLDDLADACRKCGTDVTFESLLSLLPVEVARAPLLWRRVESAVRNARRLNTNSADLPLNSSELLLYWSALRTRIIENADNAGESAYRATQLSSAALKATSIIQDAEPSVSILVLARVLALRLGLINDSSDSDALSSSSHAAISRVALQARILEQTLGGSALAHVTAASEAIAAVVATSLQSPQLHPRMGESSSLVEGHSQRARRACTALHEHFLRTKVAVLASSSVSALLPSAIQIHPRLLPTTVLLWRRLVKSLRSAWGVLAPALVPTRQHSLLLAVHRCTQMLSGGSGCDGRGEETFFSIVERPLRASSAHGPHLALALSELRDILWRYGGHPSVPRASEAFAAVAAVRTLVHSLSTTVAFEQGGGGAHEKRPSRPSADGFEEVGLCAFDLLCGSLRADILGLLGTIEAVSADEGSTVEIVDAASNASSALVASVSRHIAARLPASAASTLSEMTGAIAVVNDASGVGDGMADEEGDGGGGAASLGLDSALLTRLHLSSLSGPLMRRAALMQPSVVEPVERFCLWEEAEIIARLSVECARHAGFDLSTFSASPGGDLPARLRRLLALCNSATRWPPSDLAPLQASLWALGSSKGAGPALPIASTIGSRLRTVLPSLLASWHARAHAAQLQLRLLHSLRFLPRANNNDGGSGSSDAAQLQRTVLEAAIRRPCPLYAYEARTYALQLLAGHGATNQVWRGEDKMNTATVTAQSAAAHLLLVLAALERALSRPEQQDSYRDFVSRWWVAVSQRDGAYSASEGPQPYACTLLDLLYHGEDIRISAVAQRMGATSNVDGPLALALDAVARAIAPAPSLTHLARAFYSAALVAMLRFILLLPSSPVDPALKPTLKRSELVRASSRTRGELVLAQLMSALTIGGSVLVPTSRAAVDALSNSPDPCTAMNALALLKAEQDDERYRSREVFRPADDSKSSFLVFFSEVHDFARSHVDPTKVLALLAKLEVGGARGDEGDDDSGADSAKGGEEAEALAWASSCQGFCMRLRSQFASLADVAEPLQAAIGDLAWAVTDIVLSRRAAAATASVAPVISNPSLSEQLLVARSLRGEQAAHIVLSPVLDAWQSCRGGISSETPATGDGHTPAPSLGMTGELEEVRLEREFRAVVPDHFASHFGEFARTKQELLVDSGRQEKADAAARAQAQAESDAEHASDRRLEATPRALVDEYLGLFGSSFDPQKSAAALQFGGEDEDQLRLQALALSANIGDKVLTAVPSQWPGPTSSAAVPLLLHAIGDLSARGPAATLPQPTPSLATASAEPDSDNGYNFYRDCSPSEAVLCVRPARAFATRCHELLRLFPANEMLALLLRVTDQLLRLPSAAPIALLLSGAQLIVTKAQEWEANAPVRHQLGAALLGVSQLVTRWRKLELSSWPQLLRAADGEQRTQASELFLRLRSLVTGIPATVLAVLAQPGPFGAPGSSSWAWILPALGAAGGGGSTDQGIVDAFAGAPLAPVHAAWTLPRAVAAAAAFSAKDVLHPAQPASQVVETFLHETFEAVDRFARAAPQGQFAIRLALLGALSNELRARASAKEDSGSAVDRCTQLGLRAVYGRQALLVSNVRSFYAQYLDAVREALDVASKPVLRAVRDQASLHRWDEQSYYALRESTEKSHRIVFRTLRDYRLVLACPIGPAIDGYTAAQAAADVSREAAAPEPIARRKRSRSGKSALPLPSAIPLRLSLSDVSQLVLAGLQHALIRNHAGAQAQQDAAVAQASKSDGAAERRDFALIRRRMHQILTRRVDGLCGRNAMSARMRTAFELERRADAIFAAVEEFGTEAAPPKQGVVKGDAITTVSGTKKSSGGPTRMMKQRALTEGLRALARAGLRPFSQALAPQQASLVDLMQVPRFWWLDSDANGAFEDIKGFTAADALPRGPADLSAAIVPVATAAAASAESFFFRSVDQVLRLRLRLAAGEWHRDITGAEIRRGAGMLEHLVCLQLQQRALLVASRTQARGIAFLVDQLEALLTLGNETARPSIVDAAACLAPAALAEKALRDARALLAGAKSLLRSLARTMATAVAQSPGEQQNRVEVALTSEFVADEAVLVGIVRSPLNALKGITEISPGLVARMAALSSHLSVVEAALAAVHAARTALRRSLPSRATLDTAAALLACAKGEIGPAVSEQLPSQRALYAQSTAAVSELLAALSAARGSISNCLAEERCDVAQQPSSGSSISETGGGVMLLQAFVIDVLSRLDARLAFCETSRHNDAISGDTLLPEPSPSIDTAVSELSKEVMIAVQDIATKRGEGTLRQLWGLFERHAAPSSGLSDHRDLAKGEGEGEDKDEDEDEEEDDKLIDLPATTVQAFNALRASELPRIAAAAARVLVVSSRSASVSTFSLAADTKASISHAASLVRGMLSVHQSIELDALRLHRATCKLALVSGAVLLRLVRDGFCLPRDADDDGEGEGEPGKDSGEGGPASKEGKFHAGTGIGEGEGKRDVSDQIENEEQVLGLKGDQERQQHESAEAPKEPPSDREKGVEMQADFDGDLFDAPQPEGAGDEEEEGDEAKKEANMDEDVDREMGAADGENSRVVDEKLWNGSDSDESDSDSGENEPAPEHVKSAVKGGKQHGSRAAEGDMGESADANEAGSDDPAAGGSDGDSHSAPAPSEQPVVKDDIDIDGELGLHSGDEDVGDARDDTKVPPEADSEKAQPQQGRDKVKGTREDALKDIDDSGEGVDEEGERDNAQDSAENCVESAEAEGSAANEEGDLPDLPPRATEADADSLSAGNSDGEGCRDNDGSQEDELALAKEAQSLESAAPQGDTSEVGKEPDAANEDAAGAEALEVAVDSTADHEQRVDEQQTVDNEAEAGEPPMKRHAPPPDAERRQSEAAFGVASKSGETKLSRATDRSEHDASGRPGKQQRSAAEHASAVEPTPRADARTADEGPESADDKVLSDVDDGADGGAEGAGEDAKQGAWRRQSRPGGGQVPQQQAPPRAAKPEIAMRPDANPLVDPARALKHWQARLHETTGAEGGGEGSGSDNEGGELGEASADVTVHRRGTAPMLAPRDDAADASEEDSGAKRGDGSDSVMRDDDREPEASEVRRGDDQSDNDDAAADGTVSAASDDGKNADESADVAKSSRAKRGGAAASAVAPSGEAHLADESDLDPEASARRAAAADADENRRLLESLLAAPADFDRARDEALAVTASQKPDDDLPEYSAASPQPSARAASGDYAFDADASLARDAAVEVDPAALRAAYDSSLAAWASDTSSGAVERAQLAAEAWVALSALTAEPAARLCEGLRLALEPTMASKLGGEFRTGKRINLRKVIPYIASNFRKDKIWLRRGKPGTRTYQVLIAIDDSLSMAPGNRGGGGVAVEAMAVLARALTRLEVGEVGVMSYGRDVRLLHPFGAPFTDQAGARCLSSFSFRQDGTRTDALLEACTCVMDEARSAAGAKGAGAGGASRCMQLVFVISDGIVGSGAERERVRQWVIEASRRGVLVVLVVVDKARRSGPEGVALGAGPAGDDAPEPDRDSIMAAQTVRFEGGQVVRSPYLHNYPFPYYCVVRGDAGGSLPEVLSTALRQWVEMSAS